jgi:hypothetical protein
MMIKIEAERDEDMTIKYFVITFSNIQLKAKGVWINEDLHLVSDLKEFHDVYYVDASFLAWDEYLEEAYIETGDKE